jgi:hypothetical protein
MDNRNLRAVPSLECLTFYHADAVSSGIKDTKFRVPGDLENWGRECVLVVIIKFTEIIELVTTPFGEGFLRAEGVFHPLAGCYYSIARRFEVLPAIACNKLDVAVLRALPDKSQLPRDMVKGGPQIVNSVCYYKGDSAREAFIKVNPSCLIPVIMVGMNFNSMWFTENIGVRLPFKIGDVIVGPVNFLFGAIEHDKRPDPR